MKVTSVLMIAAAAVALMAPQAEAAPGKSKKAKSAQAASANEFDVDFSLDDEVKPKSANKSKGRKKPAKAAPKGENDVMTAEEYEAEQERIAAEEAEAYANRSGAERREETKYLREETKFYLKKQKETLSILRKVRNEKSAASAVKPMEKLYGKALDIDAVDGTLTALGSVKIMEEKEENLPVHQSSRAQAAALNKAINIEISRIAGLNIQNKKFNGVMQNMIDQQRN